MFVLPDDPSSYTFAMGNCFREASCLRTVPSNLLILSKYLPTNNSSNTNCLFNRGFYNCFALDELVGIGVPNNGHDKYMKDNKFTQTFNQCRHLKRMTFEPNQTAEWKSQVKMCIRDRNTPQNIKLKALDLLQKQAGLQTQKVQADIDKNIKINITGG